MLTFEWDKRKEAANIRKHGVSFHEASTLFLDPLSMTFFDPDHAEGEDRYITLGMATTRRILFVSHADRGERIRIISAREASKLERKGYEENNPKNG
ncbi:MAG TPA: BrnT family toxin [Desulfuromonadaceae bacterium]